MSYNPEREALRARVYIDKVLTKLPREGMILDELIRQVILNHSISAAAVETFIKRFYVDLGHIKLNEGVIYSKK